MTERNKENLSPIRDYKMDNRDSGTTWLHFTDGDGFDHILEVSPITLLVNLIENQPDPQGTLMEVIESLQVL